MSKRKQTTDQGEAPSHIAKFSNENPLFAADQFVDQVQQDARADAASGRPIKEAALIARGLAHEEGSLKGRGPRWPSLDAWIEAMLRKRPYTNDQLFAMLPQSEDCRDFYEDSGVIVSEGRKPLGRSGFDKRVTEVRKEIAKPR